MKKIILLLFLFSFNHIFPLVLNLKKEAFVTNNIIKLYDIVDNDVNIQNFIIRNNAKLPVTISSDEILKILLDWNCLNVAIIGEKCIVKENPKQNENNLTLPEISVYVAKKKIEKNSLLDPNDFAIKKIKISNEKIIKNFVLNLSDTNEYVTKTTINPGSILYWQHLEKKKALLKGDPVIFFYENALFSIKQEAILLTNGYLNETIKIKLKNGKTMNAILKKIDGVLYAKFE